MPESESGAAAAGPVVVAASQGQSILLAEDNGPAVVQMTDILTSHGYRVRERGEEILARGFDGCISKPIDEQLLGQTLREVLYGKV